jgi:hypothetical protein
MARYPRTPYDLDEGEEQDEDSKLGCNERLFKTLAIEDFSRDWLNTLALFGGVIGNDLFKKDSYSINKLDFAEKQTLHITSPSTVLGPYPPHRSKKYTVVGVSGNEQPEKG